MVARHGAGLRPVHLHHEHLVPAAAVGEECEFGRGDSGRAGERADDVIGDLARDASQVARASGVALAECRSAAHHVDGAEFDTQRLALAPFELAFDEGVGTDRRPLCALGHRGGQAGAVEGPEESRLLDRRKNARKLERPFELLAEALAINVGAGTGETLEGHPIRLGVGVGHDDRGILGARLLRAAQREPEREYPHHDRTSREACAPPSIDPARCPPPQGMSSGRNTKAQVPGSGGRGSGEAFWTARTAPSSNHGFPERRVMRGSPWTSPPALSFTSR